MKTAGSYIPEQDQRAARPAQRRARGRRHAGAGPLRAHVRHKVRAVLDLIRGETVQRAGEILQFTERDAAEVVGKCLASAVANAVNNDGQSAGELYVLACYADEGPTLKRWRPRARGRATRIRKRTTPHHRDRGPAAGRAAGVVQAREAARSTARSGRATRSAAEARRRRVAAQPGRGGHGRAAPEPPGAARRGEAESGGRRDGVRGRPVGAGSMHRPRTAACPPATRSRATRTRCSTTSPAAAPTTSPRPRFLRHRGGRRAGRVLAPA